MTVTHMFLQTFLQSVSIVTLITFPGLFGFMFVHDVLLDVLIVLKKKSNYCVKKFVYAAVETYFATMRT